MMIDDPFFYILDENKNPVACDDVAAWGEFMHNKENKRVAFTKISDEVEVSTVFLGMDHSHGDSNDPLLFETMIFGGFLNQGLARYCTYQDALKGHEAMVILAKASGQ